MRSGNELIKATREFGKENVALSWWHTLSTFAVYFSLLGGIVALDGLWYGQLALAIIAGLVQVRLFIFFHDVMHGAMFRRSALGRSVVKLIGFHLLAPPAVWKETHDYHHRNNAKMTGAAIGSYPMVTTRMWRRLSEDQKRSYKLARHPLTIFLGYFTVFHLGLCVSAARRDFAQHWGGYVALAVHWALIVSIGLTLGWLNAVLLVMVPLFVACGAGSYLFYAQHNFPDIDVRDRKDWEFTHAALKSSSYFEMSGIMHWFTGNIGYHHVHHLNHRIPFYRLPEAMKAIPELQQVGKTSWAPSDVAACLSLKLWDPNKKKMVSYEDAIPGRAARTA